ncbi:molybdopterin-dependent oxidoreductase [Nonomuraea africana]|uniref:DMSO/TMAO reductase YedYZ molybdopterin-dependent catalytic subunit n=1 Tax=Nonomuraea africana TaxID=46171 RepID=A0ABR9KWC0_9ACTN|nr:molybdopterin-dependent oxidoreductase [Nonomuraea africana]MBE1566290.1 DMSO/TMAO reductase YedYZ molybdopterin-dependent catalytic subunit [Nonomuraea africana]
MDSDKVVPAWAAALAGVVAGAVALGVAYVVAAVLAPGSFPVVAVADAAVDLSPAPVKDWAIRTFGESDKTVLVSGVSVVLTLAAAGIGVLSRRSVRLGQAGFALFGVVGLLAVVSRPDAGAVDGLATVVGALAGAWALSLLFHRAVTPAGAARPTAVPAEVPAGTSAAVAGTSAEVPAGTSADAAADVSARAGAVEPSGGESHASVERPAVMRAGAQLYAFDRRRLMIGMAGGLAVAGASGLAGQVLSGRRVGDTARTELALPRPATPARPLPRGVDLRLDGLSPFVTPNKDFYRVDTAIVVPQVDPREWTLRVHGLVDRPVELTFDDLLRRPLTEADITLTCVSNEVGGPYVGNARWLGVRMADVLRAAGLRADADMLLSTSADGFTCGTPVDVVMDGRDALFAVAMNGEALPVDHGFPVRQVVPGLYGYVSATKWVVDIKVTRFDTDQAYWTPKGWAAKGPIKTQSRIDLPKQGQTVKAGRTTVAGVAWAQHTGIEAVEVRVDGGAWQRARLAEVPGPDTWRQWALDWDAVPGEHTIEVRATDAAGRTQTGQRAHVAPDGATGWHSVNVRVA